jgi:hypothetical protein
VVLINNNMKLLKELIEGEVIDFPNGKDGKKSKQSGSKGDRDDLTSLAGKFSNSLRKAHKAQGKSQVPDEETTKKTDKTIPVAKLLDYCETRYNHYMREASKTKNAGAGQLRRTRASVYKEIALDLRKYISKN